jgi:hypothetical protein
MGRRPRNPSKNTMEEARRLWIFDFGFWEGPMEEELFQKF